MTTQVATNFDLKTAFEDIKQLVFQGKAMEAFETYYGDDVVMQENEQPATVGKDANRQRELDFFSKVTEFRGIALKQVAFGDNVIISEWSLDYTHADWGDRTYDQVSVQVWQDGKVVHERFYYGA
ncbi:MULTISPECIES: nuclear transport factor 2 family protein [unclassified Leptolyngbya]|uniref:nuclear transport factor 2 family protein n=1 Tax=unclassified Leptolyngbya TaxID=2650499 RepID=UPI001685C6EF|nr:MULTISPECIES: nuclear transport factor 2 family protein [unclassified Leptolyngbya]MBD1913951.1 nuclear transport factor 2 family protein [Leptolyngbya sp. FACHB-8]MBD2153494.1 nuclear transport factor 2 family protein [Leptolyngbya sp. FACHB-16]